MGDVIGLENGHVTKSHVIKFSLGLLHKSNEMTLPGGSVRHLIDEVT
jgi:hypothetical protein